MNCLHSSSPKRVTLATLIKCESALEQMLDNVGEKADAAMVVSYLPVKKTTMDSTVQEHEISNPQQSRSRIDYKKMFTSSPTYSKWRDTIPPNCNPFNKLSHEAQQFYLRKGDGVYIVLISLHKFM